VNKLTTRKRDTASQGKAAAMAAAVADDYMTGPVSNGRFDVDKRIHKSLKALSNAAETEDGKSVSMRMLLTEALLDLLQKYEAGNGRYPLDSDEDWSWKG
jgi:hypothetical protein